MKLDDWYCKQFEKLAAKSPYRNSPCKKIAIISTPRCGSTFICESLSKSGKFGDPSEWLNPRRMAVYARYFGFSQLHLQNYLEFVMARTVTENGIFTLNFHIDQYMYWKDQNFDPLSLGFDHIIYLYRRDKVAQAYSYAKALVTDQWRSTMEPIQTVEASKISNLQILNALNMQCIWDEIYANHLAQYVRTTFCYEEVVNKPAEYFHDILMACGIDHDDICIFNSGLEVQRREEDQARIEEFHRYLGCTHP